MKGFQGFCFKAGMLAWVVVVSSVSLQARAEVLCERMDIHTPEGAPIYQVEISETGSRASVQMRFPRVSTRDGAFLKCRQLASIHNCSKIGSETVGIHGIGEHIKEYHTIDIYGHTLQSSIAQFVRWGWADVKECNRDLVDTIAKALRY